MIQPIENSIASKYKQKIKMNIISPEYLIVEMKRKPILEYK